MKVILHTLKNPLVSLVLIYFVLAVAGISFGDRGWYEPDGVAILAGSVNLPAAKQGDFFLYRYHFQPLSYELNYFIFSIFQDAYLLYLLPVLFGGVAICFLTLAVYWFSRRRINIYFSFCFLLFFPELFYRLLYPNSSVFGMLLFSLCLLLLAWQRLNNSFEAGKSKLYFLIGIIASLACFFRFDFVFGLPILAYLIFIGSPKRQFWLSFVLGSFSAFSIGLFSGIFNPQVIVRAYNFHLLLNQSLNWSQFDSWLVLFSITNILVWIFLILYLVVWLIEVLRRRNWLGLFILMPVVFLFIPVLGKLTSAHYLLAAACLGPLLLAKAISSFSQLPWFKLLKLSFSRLVYLIVVLSLLVQFFSLEAQGKFPYFKISSYPTYALTHDQPRALGAYLKGYYRVFQYSKVAYWQNTLALSQGLAQLISSSSSDFTVVGANARVPENRLLPVASYCLPFFLQTKGYKLQFIEGAMVLIGKNNKVTIQIVNFSDYQDFGQRNIPQSAKLIKIPLISWGSKSQPEILKPLWQEFILSSSK